MLKNISYKRKLQTEEYNKLKKRKKADLIKEGKWVGFFSNKAIPKDVMPGFHHLNNKDNDLLIDYDNVFPIQNNSYHTLYHHSDISKLMKLGWYISFLKRMRLYHPNVYNKELKRQNKANLITDKELNDMWINV